MQDAAPEAAALTEAELLALEAQYCSHGDTVHYTNPPKIFTDCKGSFMYDSRGREFLDLQMWYSAVNFGYKNERLANAVRRQLDTLPQVASQYLHREKIELATMIARDAEKKFGEKGRVHFNVGGSQAVEDSLKLVRNFKGGKQLMIAFEGGYHGRTLGASAITSSYRYRRRYGHFSDRAMFIPFPYQFRGPKGMTKEEYGHECVKQFARLFESEYYGLWDPKVGEAEYAALYLEPLQGTGGYVVPPPNFFKEMKKVLDKHGILMVVDEIQMGFYRTGKLWSIEHFGVVPDAIVFGKAITNGLNPLAGVWAKEAMINPTTFPVGSTHSTFNANPMGTGVALEAMKMFQEIDFESMVMEKGAYFLEGLKGLKEKYKIVGDVDGLGMALRMEICEAHDSFTPAKRLVDMMVDVGLAGDIDVDGRKMGCVLDIGGYYKNVITLAPNLLMSKAEIDLAMKLLDRLLAHATKHS
jgi:4-aminobutyrate aminotransferase-like enzyme